MAIFVQESNGFTQEYVDGQWLREVSDHPGKQDIVTQFPLLYAGFHHLRTVLPLRDGPCPTRFFAADRLSDAGDWDIFAMLSLTDVSSGPLGRGYASDLFVRPDHRKMGYAYRLLSCLIEKARRLGMEDVFLKANPRRPDAKRSRRLYETLGFHAIANPQQHEDGTPVFYSATLFRIDLAPKSK